MWKLIVLLVVTVCRAEDIESSQVAVDERLPFFFYTVTLIVTTTLSTSSTTTLTTATTCTSLSSSSACSGKRRRRGILMSDEEYFDDLIVKPSAVDRVEPTEAPAVQLEPTRQAREAFYFYDDFYYPLLLPTFNRVPLKHYNPTYRNRSPNFERIDSDAPKAYEPDERFMFTISTSTKTTFTSIFTSTSYSATITQILLCSLPTNFSSCPPVAG